MLKTVHHSHTTFMLLNRQHIHLELPPPPLPQDFYNLVDVYLDAVFHPRCISDPKVFEQEGWHFEMEKPDVSRGGGGGRGHFEMEKPDVSGGRVHTGSAGGVLRRGGAGWRGAPEERRRRAGARAVAL